jgi:hypothetical protein
MKVLVKELISFLSKSTVDGIIRDALLDFGSEGLRIVAFDESHTGGVNALLYKDSNFQDYQEMQVPIQDVKMLISQLKIIGSGTAELIIEGNAFRVIGESFDAVFIMAAKTTTLKCPIPYEKWPKLGYDEGFEIDGSVFENVTKTVSNLKLVKKNIYAAVKDGQLTIQAGESTSDKGISKADVTYDDVSATYSETLLEFAKVMKGSIKVAFKDNMPMVVTCEDTSMKIAWMLAPVLPET